MTLPTYEPGLQSRIDGAATDIRCWMEELSPGTVEWIREDDALRSTLRAIFADQASSEDIEARVLGWIQCIRDLGR